MATVVPTDSLAHDKVTEPALRAGQHRPSIAVFLLAAVILFAADLVSKKVAFANVAGRPVTLSRDQEGDPLVIPHHGPIVLIPGVLSLRLTTNTGAVFGLGKGGQLVFVAVTILAVGVIGRVFWTSSAKAWGLHLALGLILGGALGNFYDRLRFNAVRDLLWLFPGTGLWPWIFNVADAALLVGVSIVVWVMWRRDLHGSAKVAKSD